MFLGRVLALHQKQQKVNCIVFINILKNDINLTSGNQNQSRKVLMCGPLSSARWEIILSS